MNEQPKDPSSLPQTEAAKLDPIAASAALALAVTSAEKSNADKPSAEKSDGETSRDKKSCAAQPKPVAEKAGDRLQKLQAVVRRGNRKHMMQAAALALALGLGWAGGSQALSGGRQALQTLPGWVEAATAGFRQNQEDIVRLTGEVNALKGVIESFKDSLEAKIHGAGNTQPFMERVESLERAGQDTTAKIVRVAEAADRIERAGTAADAKLAAVVGRLDTLERQAVGADPMQTAGVPAAKAAAKAMPVEGWVLREVYDGGALVEGRNGRLHEVAPGRTLPSVGRVEAIERRGKIWVVVTSKGVIGPPERWR